MRFLFAVLFATSAFAQEFDIKAAQPWTDTGIDVVPGEILKITAAGSLKYANASRENGPDGLARSWTDLIRALPVNEAGRGALVARIGDRDASRALLIGPKRETRVAVAGRLFLGVNQTANDSAEGSFHVVIERIKPAASSTAPRDVRVPAFPQKLLDSLPLRVVDAAGTEGDRINFLIVGSENKVQAALQTAGWVKVDKSNRDAALRGLLVSLSKQAYVTVPMSELMMFGRGQDFGYAQADPVKVIASRHHFRIWKAPFQLEGRTVWVGAGTHDIGFDRDQRNNKLTHKIDPEVDKERDYIGRSLSESGTVIKLDYLTPANPIRVAKTAHGEEFRSDGRTLIVYLEDDAPDFARAFADIFCSVLGREKEDWGACDKYIDGGGKKDLDMPALDSKYRVLIVPGILSSCASDAPAFLEGQQALKEKYGIDVSLLPMPNDSSEDNARRIATYLRDKSKDDPRKFIVLGYSKGTPDIQTALAKEDGVAALVAAFVSVAGASGGSPIADVLPAQADRWISQFKMGGCQGDLSSGFKSLQKRVRQAFLAAFPNPLVPTYSIVAQSDRSTTSKALMQAWELLSVFGSSHDAQVIRDDAIVPGAKFLGAARADHFAIALPFDKAPDASIRSLMDRGRYPRAALLESLVRFVVADLEKSR
jgi:LssY-like putative type I secretion system component LssY